MSRRFRFTNADGGRQVAALIGKPVIQFSAQDLDKPGRQPYRACSPEQHWHYHPSVQECLDYLSEIGTSVTLADCQLIGFKEMP